MRKNILSLSIAAMIGGLGLAGGAIAAVNGTPGSATQLEVTPEGIGHILLVPYFTAQSGNITTLSIVNTDETNGKAVKVRFRGASNSDDVYDFTLFLSPGDVWSAKVGKNASTGIAELSTEDNSCTLPTNVGTNAAPRPFVTTRVNPKGDTALETREGYVEILNMADVPPSSAVYTATKHGVNGMPPSPCALGATLSATSALRPLLTQAGIDSAGFSNPTSGLFANWSIIDLNDGAAWSGAATAIVATTSGATTAGSGNIVMFPQNNGTPGYPVASLTADPLLLSGAVAIQHFDLPDLSTPYTGASVTPAAQAAKLSGSLAKTTIKNEFVTDDRIGAQNDWVFSLPTRRYSVALDYAATGGAARVYTALTPAYFNSANTTVEGTAATSKICVTDVTRVVWDRSEQKLENDDDFVISPSDPLKKVNLCGEVAVWSINAGSEFAPSALHGAVARKDIDVKFQNGWAKFVTPGIASGSVNQGLPILGSSFVKIQNGLAGLGNYGVSWEHRYTRPTGAVGANNP